MLPCQLTFSKALITSRQKAGRSFASLAVMRLPPQRYHHSPLAPCLSRESQPQSSNRIRVDRAGSICNGICVYTIRFALGVLRDLKRLSAYRRTILFEAIDTQLAHEPTAQTKNRKLLVNLVPPWDAVAPIWELRVGEYRVFYDVSAEGKTVYIRAIRRKPTGSRTEEIL